MDAPLPAIPLAVAAETLARDRFRGCILPPRAILFASIPERRLAGPSQRDTYQHPRARRLSPDQEAELRRLAPGRTLRDLALTFGVSHETVRKTLRENQGAGGGGANHLLTACNGAMVISHR